jgi:hypothetical protein
MNQEIRNKLLTYQVQHTEALVESLKKHNRALDASDTGTGKTYSAIAIAKILGLKPFIICPKSVIQTWSEVLDFFDCPYYGISNYELIQNCRYYKTWGSERSKCPFVTREQKDVAPKKKKDIKLKDVMERIEEQRTGNDKKKKKIKYIYKWKFPDDVLIIFDEAHRCKNKKTNTSSILISASQSRSSKFLLLSATIADKPITFEVCGYVLGLFSNIRNAKHWLNRHCEDSMSPVFEKLYPEYASRMKIVDLGNLFPKNNIKCECLHMENAKEIAEQYKIIEDAVAQIHKEEEGSGGIGALMKARMKIEHLKIPTMLNKAREYLKNGFSVSIFLNFTGALLTLADELSTNCVIYGEQTIEDRIANIKMFNENESNIIICNIKAGGVGISLHDTKGLHPRVSLISPTWSAQDLLQALGRIHRANGKTDTIQEIIFCKDTVESYICENVRAKIHSIAEINDGNLNSYKIDGFTQNVDNEDITTYESISAKLEILGMQKTRLTKDTEDLDVEIGKMRKLLETVEKTPEEDLRYKKIHKKPFEFSSKGYKFQTNKTKAKKSKTKSSISENQRFSKSGGVVGSVEGTPGELTERQKMERARLARLNGGST